MLFLLAFQSTKPELVVQTHTGALHTGRCHDKIISTKKQKMLEKVSLGNTDRAKATWITIALSTSLQASCGKELFL